MLLSLLATYAAFVVETSVVPLLGLASFAPRVVLATLVCLVWRAGGRSGLWMAAAWGLISDGLSTGPLGIDVVVYVLAAAGIQTIRDRILDSSPAMGLTAGLVAFVVPIVGTGIRMAAERHAIEWDNLVVAAAPAACSTGLLTIGFVLAFRSLFSQRSSEDAASTASVSNRWSMLTE